MITLCFVGMEMDVVVSVFLLFVDRNTKLDVNLEESNRLLREPLPLPLPCERRLMTSSLPNYQPVYKAFLSPFVDCVCLKMHLYEFCVLWNTNVT